MRWRTRPSPTGARRVTPHAVLEVRTGAGDPVWRWDRDGPKPTQAIPASVASDMAGMMSHVVSEGTARRAALDGIPTAGKTGTTNAYRDAWFVGYTGNFTCAVWYGNDDYSPTNRMTGGSLPAQTWHEIMVVGASGRRGQGTGGCRHGHQAATGNLPRLPSRPTARRRCWTSSQERPRCLTRRGADILVQRRKDARRRRQDRGQYIRSTNRRRRPSRRASSVAGFPGEATSPRPATRLRRRSGRTSRMIRKSGSRFSGKIMRKQNRRRIPLPQSALAKVSSAVTCD